LTDYGCRRAADPRGDILRRPAAGSVPERRAQPLLKTQ
jgi:hypothetical protein